MKPKLYEQIFDVLLLLEYTSECLVGVWIFDGEDVCEDKDLCRHLLHLFELHPNFDCYEFLIDCLADHLNQPLLFLINQLHHLLSKLPSTIIHLQTPRQLPPVARRNRSIKILLVQVAEMSAYVVYRSHLFLDEVEVLKTRGVANFLDCAQDPYCFCNVGCSRLC